MDVTFPPPQKKKLKKVHAWPIIYTGSGLDHASIKFSYLKLFGKDPNFNEPWVYLVCVLKKNVCTLH